MKLGRRGRIILKVIVIFIIINIIACPIITKVVYDSVFDRYDGVATVEITGDIKTLYDSRVKNEFVVGDNKLSGYFYDSSDKDILVVLAPGFNASCDNYLNVIKRMHDAGLGVFTFDTTGSCTSEGRGAVGFQQELVDLDKALDYVNSQGDFGYENIALFGHSRGGYAAGSVMLFDHKDVDSIVTVGGINSGMEGIMEPSVGAIGKAAYLNYPMLYLYQIILFGKKVTDADVVTALSSSDAAILIIHGAEDKKISLEEYSIYSHKAEIEALGRSAETRFVLGDKAGMNGHTDILDDTALIDEAISFITQNVR